jgi:Sigma-70, region 4
LTDRERQLLSLRFCDDLNQTKTAEEMGLSQMHIATLLAAAVAADAPSSRSHARPDMALPDQGSGEVGNLPHESGLSVWIAIGAL